MTILAFAAVPAVPLLWALFWPHSACSQPACARQRFSLYVELDSFRNVEPIALELPDHEVSAREILRSGGIDAEFVFDDAVLPYSPASGPLDRADLYQYSQVWRNRAVPARADGKVYAMLTPALVSDAGERLFGIMFDHRGREGIAISPAETIRAFANNEPQNVSLLQLRTFVHELLHALNRTHLDAVQRGDGAITLEAPTRCLATVQSGKWQLTTAPAMALSPATIRFFQTADARDILPGASNSPYDGLQSSPTECAEVRANRSGRTAATRWQLAMQRLRALMPFSSASADEPLDAAAESEPITRSVGAEIRIQAQEAPYPLGYPIAIRIMVRNTGDEPLPLKRRLAPGYGMVKIQYRASTEEEWNTLRPLEWYEPANDTRALLDPGSTYEQTVPIYFGEDGWTFDSPGSYQVRATLTTSEEIAPVASDPIEITIAEPQSVSEEVVVSGLLDKQGVLDDELGRLLIFGGRIGTSESRAPIEHLVSSHEETALGSALHLTLASQRLAPAIDPLTGERAEPDFADARTLLEDSCSDSGIAALKQQLLRRYSKAPLGELRSEGLTNAQAWDGRAEGKTKVPTYSDPALQRFGPSLHFCLNEASLSGTPRARARQLAAQLRSVKPKRLIAIGHADRQGNCALNDDLALARARAVVQVLRPGLRGTEVHAVSLGERRPLDFGSTPEALQLNRRVELLVEFEDEAPNESPRDATERVLPRCSR